MDAYLIYRLTEGRVFATDATNASRTLLYDLRQPGWSEALCALFGIPRHGLPEIRACDDFFGETTFHGLLERPIPICGVMGDSQAACFAQRCFSPGTAKATFGTGVSLMMALGPEPRPAPPGIATVPAWAAQGRTHFAWEGMIKYAGGTITWLQDQLGLIQNASDCEALAASVPDNGGVFLVPAFAGMGAPSWNAEARAGIVGLTAHSTRAHVVRAALEAISYQLADLITLLQPEGGPGLMEIRADGGMTENRFLMQFTADLCRQPVSVSHLAELSGQGAALMGLLGTGVQSSLDEIAALPYEATTYIPTLAPASAQKLYQGWQQACRHLLT
jgi:glycerol kinase